MSQIMIPDDRVSRHHAEFVFRNGSWVIRDLESRNGVLVDQQSVREEQVLSEGQTVTIAGCQMLFVQDISQAFAALPSAAGEGTERGDATEDLGENDLITHRQRSPRIYSAAAAQDRAAEIATLALKIAKCADWTAAANVALEAALKRARIESGAILQVAGSASSLGDAGRHKPTDAGEIGLQVVAAHHRAGRGYHRLPAFLAQLVHAQGEGILARNINNDAALAQQDSHGQLSAKCTIVVPIRKNQASVGLLHLYSVEDEPQLQPEHLEFSLIAADLLGAAWESLGRQAELMTRLDRSRRRVEQLRAQLGSDHQILGSSAAISAVREMVSRVGATQATVLVRGESGTGKELVAAALHETSARRDGPLVCLNCAALSPALLESELFGHEKGAFTGATDRKLGKFEAADGGTLLLDEIGEMVLDIQAKFLRVLEGHPFERVGGNRPIRTDVRVIAATNRDLEQAVREGKFREDLYYRLHVVELRLPPLRERGEDVIELARAFLQRFSLQVGRRVEGISPLAEAKLRSHHWPGNIRELRNVIERAVVLGTSPWIEVDELVIPKVRAIDPVGARPEIPSSPEQQGTADAEFPSIAELEWMHIQKVLRATGGNKSRAAAILGIERSTLDRKLKRN